MARTPNDDRSDSLNPTSDAHKASQDNRSRQINDNSKPDQGDAKAPAKEVDKQ